MSTTLQKVTSRITYGITSAISLIPSNIARTGLMSSLIYVLGFLDTKLNVYEEDDYKIYNCYDERQVIQNQPRYYWIELPETRMQYVQPYLKFYRNPKDKTLHAYPDIDKVMTLYKPTTLRRVHPHNINLFFAWFANYWSEMFLHTTYGQDKVPSNMIQRMIPKPMYGMTKNEEAIIRLYRDGKVRLHGDGTPCRLSDLRPDEREQLNIMNPYNKDVFVSGIVRGNISVGHYVMQTLCMRNHNRICDMIKEVDSSLDDDAIFKLAKTINTYIFVNTVIGPYTTTLSGNKVNIKSEYYSRSCFTREKENITWEFNVVYQWHGLLPERVSDVTLDNFAFYPEQFYSKGIGEWLGIALRTQCCEHRLMNTQEYFMPVERSLLEVSRAANLLPYCEYRRKLKLKVPRTFEELTGGDTDMASKLRSVYGDIENVEFHVGIQAEPLQVAMFGETMHKMIGMVALQSLPRILGDYREYIKMHAKSEKYMEIINKFGLLDEYVKGVLTNQEIETINFKGKITFNAIK